MSKVFRFLVFMAPIVAGAICGNLLLAKVHPEMRDKSPWFWLLTGSLGAASGMVVRKLLFGYPPAPTDPTPKTDPVPGPKPAGTYEEWRKDLDRTVDENAPDFLPLQDFVDKWSDVPRSSKKAAVDPDLGPGFDKAIDMMAEKHKEAMEHLRASSPSSAPVANVVGAPDNVIKYVQKEAMNALDPFFGEKVPGRMYIVVDEGGLPFHRGDADLVEFYSDLEAFFLDGHEWKVPMGGRIAIHVPAGSHYVIGKKRCVQTPDFHGVPAPYRVVPDVSCAGCPAKMHIPNRAP